MSVIGSNILAGASGQGGEYTLARSLRFRSSASAYLNRTVGTSNRQVFTFSKWVKRGALGISTIYGANIDGNNEFTIRFAANDTLQVYDYQSGYNIHLNTTAVYRDPSAWYHIVVAIDTTQATNTNRAKLYVNGVQVTALGTATYPSQNYNTLVNSSSTTYNRIGSMQTSSGYFDGYTTEVNFIDGQALTPSSFGETSSTTGVWQPKRYAGTYGTNGFYLPFTDNSALTSGSNAGLGKDFSGNGNYWTTNNISITSGSTYDSMTDVPTLTSATAANYCVLNPVAGLNTTSTISSANLQYQNSSANQNAIATFQLPSTGKYYWEVALTAIGAGYPLVGLAASSAGNGSTPLLMYIANGNKLDQTASSTSYGSSWTTGDVIGVAVDMDAGTLVFYKNNVSQGTAFSSITSLLPNGIYPCLRNNTSSDVMVINFGQRPFAYTPPTGFVALNTYNLPTPTIGATASSQANKYFDATLYTGNGTSQSIVNSGSMQPDMVWQKDRTQALGNMLFDSVRGTGKYLFSDSTDAEATEVQTLSSFNSNGFSVGSNGHVNTNNDAYVAWQWRASNAAGVTNTAGSITSTVSANTTSGFSVVTYTGNGSAGATVGHGLGVAPRMLIIKARNGAGYSWKVYHGSLGSGSHLELDSTAAAQGGIWNSTNPSSTVFTLGTNAGVNENGKNYVCYAFADVTGYSKLGSYTGNGSTDGVFVYTGFRPRYILLRRSNAIANWLVYDTARATFNVANNILLPDDSSSELTAADYNIDILSNGFKLRTNAGGLNGGTDNMIYACFAENPFKYSLAR